MSINLTFSIIHFQRLLDELFLFKTVLKNPDLSFKMNQIAWDFSEEKIPIYSWITKELITFFIYETEFVLF